MPKQRLRARTGALWCLAVCAGLAVLGPGGRAAAQGVAASSAETAAMGSTTPSGYQEVLAQGKALLKAGQSDEAMGKFEAAIQQAQAEGQPSTTLSYLHCLLGMVQAQAGAAKRPGALASLQKAVELDPTSADCRLELAQSQFDDKQYSEAQRSADAVLQQPGIDDSLRTEATALAKRAHVMALFADGRRLLKGRDPKAAAARIKEAVEGAEAAGLSTEERSLMHYVRVLALRQASEDEEAIEAARSGIALSPNDADLHLELAQALFDTDAFVPARKAAEASLRLGLSDSSDQKTASDLIKKAKTESLHERFTFFGAVSFGYDSNVLQSGKVETIGGKCASCPNGTRTLSRDSMSAQQILSRLLEGGMPLRNPGATYTTVISDAYKAPVPPQEEWDLPIDISLDLNGRLLGTKKLELWLGYRFYQLFMSSVGFNHDAYNLQEHTVPLLLSWQPARWLLLRPHLDGFVNFSGLSGFTPYQGGLLAAFDAQIIEGRTWRTRVLYQHQLRRSFNREDDAYLDGDRDEVRLTQELRVRGKRVRLRGSLSYRLRSDRTGVYEDAVPFPADLLQHIYDSQGNVTDTLRRTVEIGNYLYRAPLGYLSNEVSTRWRLSLPLDFDLAAGGSFDYRVYDDQYRATFVTNTVAVVRECDSSMPMCSLNSQPERTFPPPGSAISRIEMPSVQRKDSTVSVDITASKSLPLGFSLDVSYAFVKNFSNIANGVDNRNYTKHQILLSAGYAF